MVKIDFDRPGIDSDWTASHKRSDTSPKESGPSGKRTRLLDDVGESVKSINLRSLGENSTNHVSQDEPASQTLRELDQEETVGADDVTVQSCQQTAASNGYETEEQQNGIVVASPLAEQCLGIDQNPQESKPAGEEHEEKPNQEQNQVQVHESQLVSQAPFFSCFSWLTSLAQPAQAPPQSQTSDPTDTLDHDLERALLESASLHEAEQVSIAEARARLQIVMDTYNMKPRPVEADGNCQFRALAQQLYGDESQHQSIRSRMVDQLKSTPECYSGFVHETFEDYVNRMSRDGQWGDNVTLQAASDMLGTEIHILTDQPGAEHLEVRPASQNADQPQSPLWLAFLAEVHYDAVVVL